MDVGALWQRLLSGGQALMTRAVWPLFLLQSLSCCWAFSNK